ncbi:MAG: HD-GYP domain-containing protein [bacterium]|nr:HD-GYP domain-containing protein [bacterium]MDD5354139.1 HD-GYP domain-containing protein [bacterium]MDD5755948.1 HD-GYP domain-containing protein [bacterium]
MINKNISFFTNQNLRSIARRLLKQIPATIKNAQIYPPDHPYFVNSLESVQETLTELFKYRPEATFSIVENELYFGRMALVEDTLSLRQFIFEFEKRKINSLTFMAAVTNDELVAFMQLLGREFTENCDSALLSGKMRERNITNIQLGALLMTEDAASQEDGRRAEMKFDAAARKKAQGSFFGSIDVIKQVMHNVENNQGFALNNVHQVVTDIASAIDQNDKYLLGLTTMKNFDEYTFNHSVNVAILSLYLGKLLGLDLEQLRLLGEAAMLHDVGKVRIPKEILNKQGKLTPAEWEVMESHSTEGAEVLSQITGISELSLVVALEHHMRYDLSGYPKPAKLKETNLLARLVTICDVYDAATSLRVYHAPALPASIIGLIISKKGSFFDPVLAKAFVQLMGLYPVGSLVRLNNNALAVVYANNLSNILRPKVILVNQQTAGQDPVIISLEDIDRGTKTFKYSIVEALAPQAYNIDVTEYFYAQG